METWRFGGFFAGRYLQTSLFAEFGDSEIPRFRDSEIGDLEIWKLQNWSFGGFFAGLYPKSSLVADYARHRARNLNLKLGDFVLSALLANTDFAGCWSPTLVVTSNLEFHRYCEA